MGDQPGRQLGERFGRTLMDATRVHADTVRKGTDIPYTSHLLGVCALVLEAGGDEDAAISAPLHDAIEAGAARRCCPGSPGITANGSP